MKRAWNRNRRIHPLALYIKRTKVNPLTECHIWRGAKDRYGYGSLRRENKTYQAHKFFYELFVKKVEPGYELHHICENGDKGCVNWLHLREVTRRQHMLIRYERLRQQNKRKW